MATVGVEGMRNSASRRQLASPSDKRVTYGVQIQYGLTPIEKRRLEARARAERRTPSNYVATPLPHHVSGTALTGGLGNILFYDAPGNRRRRDTVRTPGGGTDALSSPGKPVQHRPAEKPSPPPVCAHAAMGVKPAGTWDATGRLRTQPDSCARPDRD